MGSNPRDDAPYDLHPSHTVLLGWISSRDSATGRGSTHPTAPIGEFTAQQAHAFALARFHCAFGQTPDDRPIRRAAGGPM